MQRNAVQHDTRRLIRKLGNPSLFCDPQGRLHLWFVSVSYGGWAGSAINHSTSMDGGLSWTPATRLVTSPFWNLSTLVRSPAIAINDKGIGLPAYHEFIAKRAEWLRLDAGGQVVDKARVPAAAATIQPAVAALGANRALALLRDAGPMHRIRLTSSADAGQHWQPAATTALPNPNAGIALLRLADGALLLAYNPQEHQRTQLALALSHDDGETWSAPRLVEQGTDQDEFSYPALLQDADGMIHLAYTWKREAIRHLRFSAAWVEAAP
jgi:predicted neuraminidase